MSSVLAVILNFFCKEIDGIRSKKTKSNISSFFNDRYYSTF